MTDDKIERIMKRLGPVKIDVSVELRKELVQFREKVIYPDTENRSECLLRRQMIDEFVEHRPASFADMKKWFKIGLLEGTSQDEIARWLPDVLRVVKKYS